MTLLVLSPVCIADEKEQKEGLFSEGSFFSEAISSMSDKVNKVTSGKEEIINDNAKGVDKDILEYDGNPLGRNRPKMKVIRGHSSDNEEND